jgi:hypothetical protein
MRCFYLLFFFLSNRFLGSFGFFVLETLTAKQINLYLRLLLNEYKVWYCLLPQKSYRQVQSLGWIVTKRVGVGGLFCVLATHRHPLSRRKEKASKTEKLLALGLSLQPQLVLHH